jgi:hypothetical protein
LRSGTRLLARTSTGSRLPKKSTASWFTARTVIVR